jgi:N-acetylneuraminate synthase
MILVAEFTVNHFGHPLLLERMFDVAIQSGCDFVKLQKKDVESFYSSEKLASPYHSPFGITYGDYRSSLELSISEFKRFDEKARDKWFATVQDIKSLHEMLEFDLPMYKIASCNTNNVELLREAAKSVPTNKIIVLSVAGRTLAEISDLIDVFPHHQLIVNHCVAIYPCPPEELRLGNIKVLIDEFQSDRVKIGYSGHEVGLEASLFVMKLGVYYLERHFCLNRSASFVHHRACSLEPHEFTKLAKLKNDQPLPNSSFATSFGESWQESKFLRDQVYGD